MIRRIINFYKGIPPCIKHIYILTDVMYIGKPGKAYSYKIACENCGKSYWTDELDLRKRYELGLIYLDDNDAIRIFGKGIENTVYKPNKLEEN